MFVFWGFIYIFVVSASVSVSTSSGLVSFFTCLLRTSVCSIVVAYVHGTSIEFPAHEAPTFLSALLHSRECMRVVAFEKARLQYIKYDSDSEYVR